MGKKSDRAIVAPGVTFGDELYKPGDEAELAKVAPQWNINQMVEKGWLIGDWADAGVPQEKEAALQAAAETDAGAGAVKRSSRKPTR